ncbi:MAG: hypothetical protein JXA81_07260 [Sedimentisphaerales bacterium]|nr:hypothetical protein [Sedimentisphaerales bacterium]
MENTKCIMVLIVATVLIAGVVQAAEQPQTKVSSTRQASCLVKVTCAPAILPLGFETIDYLLHSSGVSGKAVREVLNISTDQAPGDYCTIEYVQELSSNAAPKSSIGRSSGPEKMDEFGYALMDEKAQHDEMLTVKPKPSTSPPRFRGFSRRTPSTASVIPATTNLPAEEQAYLFSLYIQLPLEVKPAAEELMDALLYNLRTALAGVFEEHKQRLMNQFKLADDEAARSEDELKQKQQELHSIFGSRILDRNRILDNISNLSSDIQKIEMDQAVEKATVDATTKRIAETKAKIQEEIDKDTVTKELLKMIDLNMVRLHDAKKLVGSGQGQAADNDLAEAWEKLTKTRIELAQRREQLSRSAGGNLIESFNLQLANYSIEAAQNQAKLKSLEERIGEAKQLLVLGKAEDYELLSLKADIAKQNLHEAVLWRDRVSRQMRIIQPPSVSVIGGD